jgi:hypothetical protein
MSRLITWARTETSRAELVRVTRRRLGAQAHLFHEPPHPLAPLGGVAAMVHDQRLLQDAAHRHAWVERCVGVLEDHLHHRPQGTQCGA